MRPTASRSTRRRVRPASRVRSCASDLLVVRTVTYASSVQRRRSAHEPSTATPDRHIIGSLPLLAHQPPYIEDEWPPARGARLTEGRGTEDTCYVSGSAAPARPSSPPTAS